MVLFGGAAVELYLLQFGLTVSLFLPVLKGVFHMVYYLLPYKLKISLGQFFADLIQSICLIGYFIQLLISPGKCNCGAMYTNFGMIKFL